MSFSWWWIIIVAGAIWLIGALVGTFVIAFLDPLTSKEEKLKDWRGRLVAGFFMGLLFWPWMVPATLERRKLLHDMYTGKRPSWIVLDRSAGEEHVRYYTLADGTKFDAAAYDGSSTEPSLISADYEDRTFTGRILYQISMTHPTPGTPGEWLPLEMKPFEEKAELLDDCDQTEESDDFDARRFNQSLQMPRGKYAVAFRVKNRSGEMELCPAITLIVADPEDYNL